MQFFKLFIVLFILTSCKKENIYYYSNNTPIKDSVVIRFVEKELQKININTLDKNLKIHTTLDSISYKPNIDSIRTQIFRKALQYNLKPDHKKAFDEWFREKIIVADNQTGKIVQFYSSFRKAKFDRHDIGMGSLRKMVRLGSLLNTDPNTEIQENYLFNYQTISSNDLKIEKREAQFLSKFNITDLQEEGYYLNNISFLDALKMFQSFNTGILKEPYVIKEVFNKNQLIYSRKEISQKIFALQAKDKIQQNLKYYKDHSFGYFKNELKNTQSLITFGTNLDQCLIVNDRKYTYLIYNFRAVITDLEKKNAKEIPYHWLKTIGVQYYNAIRK